MLGMASSPGTATQPNQVVPEPDRENVFAHERRSRNAAVPANEHGTWPSLDLGIADVENIFKLFRVGGGLQI